MNDIDSKTLERNMHWSQRRCLVCDRYSLPHINEMNWVCNECKQKESTKMILEMQRVSGLIAYFSKQVHEKWKEFDFASRQLFGQEKRFEELKKKLEEKENRVGEKTTKTGDKSP